MRKMIASFCLVCHNDVFHYNPDKYFRFLSWSVSSARTVSNDRQGVICLTLSGD